MDRTEIIRERMENWPAFPEDLEKQILENDWRLQKSRYLFYHKARSGYVGYCTHCRKIMDLDGSPGHKNGMQCPCCGSYVQTRAEGISRKYLEDESYAFVPMLRDDELYVSTIHIRRCYWPAVGKEYTEFSEEERFYFSEKEARKYHTEFKFISQENRWKPRWVENKRFSSSECGKVWMYPIPRADLESGFLKNSRLQEVINLGQPHWIDYLALYIKYPKIEHLVQPGFVRLLEEKLSSFGDKRIVNELIDWRKGSPAKMLGVGKPEAKAIQEKLRLMTSIKDIWIEQTAARQGVRLDMGQISALNNIAYMRMPLAKRILESGHIVRELGYLQRQVDIKYKKKENQNFYLISNIATEWDDYLIACRKIGWDTADDAIRYPKNLTAAHDRAVAQIKYIENEALRKRLAGRARKLEALSWQEGNLLIRPATNESELIAEGKVLSHCVATYAERHAKGETAIFFIRHVDDPGLPYFTLELDEKNLSVRQNRGKRNCARTPEVEAFEKHWLEHIRAERKEKTEERMSAG